MVAVLTGHGRLCQLAVRVLPAHLEVGCGESNQGHLEDTLLAMHMVFACVMKEREKGNDMLFNP